MKLPQGEYLHDFITKHNLRECLELGFYHGVSSAYLAGAIQDLGSGTLTTIDLLRARDLRPNIEYVLASLGLAQYVEHYFEPASYTWRLMKFLEAGRHERYDFCYIDGGHTWDCTGFAFFLVTKLLKPGGWLLLDDLNWTIEVSKKLAALPWAMRLPLEQRQTPQVRNVYELLVKTDPQYGDFSVRGEWAFARKLPRSAPALDTAGSPCVGESK